MAQSYLTESGNVNFLSKASLNEFNGESDKLNGLIDLSQNLLDFYVDLNTLDTGIGLRNKHMRDNYLETEDYLLLSSILTHRNISCFISF